MKFTSIFFAAGVKIFEVYLKYTQKYWNKQKMSYLCTTIEKCLLSTINYKE